MDFRTRLGMGICALALCAASAQAAEPFRIGVVGLMSGPIGVVGTQGVGGMQVALERAWLRWDPQHRAA